MKKLTLELNLNGLFDPDSQYNSYMNGKSRKKKSPQEKLGIEDDGMERLGGEPMKMMDILDDLVGSMYEEEEDDGELEE